MRAAVLGLGKIGHGTAARLAERGLEVCAYTRSKEKAEAVNRYGITASGALEGNYRIRAYSGKELPEAVGQADLLVVATTSAGHRPVAESLKGLLRPAQRILILTGNWGALDFSAVLGEEAREKQVIIGETSGNIAAVPSLSERAEIFVKPAKKHIAFAAVPPELQGNLASPDQCAGPALSWLRRFSGSALPTAVRMAEELKDAFPELTPVKNVLTTSFNNTNPPVHAPICLFNLTRMENAEDASFYGECLPPFLERFLTAADRERVTVGRAIGADAETLLDLMNSAWETNCSSVKELGLSNPSLKLVRLPKTLQHRFLTEDIPCGLVPVSRLGRQLGIPTPCTDLMIEIYRQTVAGSSSVQVPLR